VWGGRVQCEWWRCGAGGLEDYRWKREGSVESDGSDVDGSRWTGADPMTLLGPLFGEQWSIVLCERGLLGTVVYSIM
jgi:hypothetical protein